MVQATLWVMFVVLRNHLTYRGLYKRLTALKVRSGFYWRGGWASTDPIVENKRTLVVGLAIEGGAAVGGVRTGRGTAGHVGACLLICFC